MTIEINSYGLQVDSNWFYLALSWNLIVASAIVYVGYKFYQKRKKAK